MNLLIIEKSFIEQKSKEKILNANYINYFSKKNNIVSYKNDYILINNDENLINSDLFIKVVDLNNNLKYLIMKKNVKKVRKTGNGLYIYFNSVFADLFFKKGSTEYELLLKVLNEKIKIF